MCIEVKSQLGTFNEQQIIQVVKGNLWNSPMKYCKMFKGRFIPSGFCMGGVTWNHRRALSKGHFNNEVGGILSKGVFADTIYENEGFAHRGK